MAVDVSRRLGGHMRAAGHAGYAAVKFGATDEQTLTYGAGLTFDTRMDPVFPRNAVFASAGWERLDPDVSAAVNRFNAEARGYLGVVGQSVLALSVQYAGADGTQPDYARPLLGGARHAARLRGREFRRRQPAGRIDRATYSADVGDGIRKGRDTVVRGRRHGVGPRSDAVRRRRSREAPASEASSSRACSR